MRRARTPAIPDTARSARATSASASAWALSRSSSGAWRTEAIATRTASAERWSSRPLRKVPSGWWDMTKKRSRRCAATPRSREAGSKDATRRAAEAPNSLTDCRSAMPTSRSCTSGRASADDARAPAPEVTRARTSTWGSGTRPSRTASAIAGIASRVCGLADLAAGLAESGAGGACPCGDEVPVARRHRGLRPLLRDEEARPGGGERAGQSVQPMQRPDPLRPGPHVAAAQRRAQRGRRVDELVQPGEGRIRGPPRGLSSLQHVFESSGRHRHDQASDLRICVHRS